MGMARSTGRSDVAEHHTKNTVAVSNYCKKCGKFTMHRVASGLVGPCQQCLDKPLEKQREPPAKQEEMF